MIASPPQHVDILPTILDLRRRFRAGTDSTVARFVRRSKDAQSGHDVPIYFEALDANLTRGWAPLRGVVIRGGSTSICRMPELYHLDVRSR